MGGFTLVVYVFVTSFIMCTCSSSYVHLPLSFPPLRHPKALHFELESQQSFDLDLVSMS